MSDSVEGITAKSLAFEYPGRVVWQELSFTLTPGSLAAVRGESGSGKTTLLQCLGSLEQSTTGSLCVFGQDVGALRGAALREFRRNCVGFVFQNAGWSRPGVCAKTLRLGGTASRMTRSGRVRFLKASGCPSTFWTSRPTGSAVVNNSAWVSFGLHSDGRRSCCWMSPRLPLTTRIVSA